MSQSSSSSLSDVDGDFVSCQRPDIKIEDDESEYSLQPYLFEPTKNLPSSDENSDENESDDQEESSSSNGENRLNDLEW